MGCTIIPLVVGILMMYNVYVMYELKGDSDENKKSDEEKGMLNSIEKQMIARMLSVGMCVLTMVVETVMIGVGMRNGEEVSGYVINKMMATAVTVMVMLSMMRYIMSRKQEKWYHAIMIGGSVVIGSIRALMMVNKNISEHVYVLNIVMIGGSVMMVIASVVVCIKRKGADKMDANNEILGRSVNGTVMRMIGAAAAFGVALIGWMMQSMNFDGIIDGDMTDVMLQ
ncbi:hypothetical protein HK407_02g03720 [Ordospora pajunii]|uniref:uncharacterized protein n=1 Tax=Ordospora pajunii TaxID=3039483 RepID=UPI0029529044|nr:uncharacterized protein HK407_02g03720 [Ordospora pajunii]KAH9411927.1 hypothetical protein HK407_02g03720 [Ordospora pajunii]